MQWWKIREWKHRHGSAGVENAGVAAMERQSGSFGAIRHTAQLSTSTRGVRLAAGVAAARDPAAALLTSTAVGAAAAAAADTSSVSSASSVSVLASTCGHRLSVAFVIQTFSRCFHSRIFSVPVMSSVGEKMYRLL